MSLVSNDCRVADLNAVASSSISRLELNSVKEMRSSVHEIPSDIIEMANSQRKMFNDELPTETKLPS